FLGLMGSVGAMCVLVAVLIAVTLTPAMLSLVGMRILSRRERARLADHAPVAAAGDATAAVTPAATTPLRPMSTGRALLRVVGGVAALILVALPAAQLRLGLPDGSS